MTKGFTVQMETRDLFDAGIAQDADGCQTAFRVGGMIVGAIAGGASGYVTGGVKGAVIGALGGIGAGAVDREGGTAGLDVHDQQRRLARGAVRDAGD